MAGVRRGCQTGLLSGARAGTQACDSAAEQLPYNGSSWRFGEYHMVQALKSPAAWGKMDVSPKVICWPLANTGNHAGSTGTWLFQREKDSRTVLFICISQKSQFAFNNHSAQDWTQTQVWAGSLGQQLTGCCYSCVITLPNNWHIIMFVNICAFSYFFLEGGGYNLFPVLPKGSTAQK